MNHEDWMRHAIEVAREGIDAGQAPFGTVIVREGVLLSRTHNTVWRDLDSTAHAEINAIRQADQAVQSVDLSGAILYSTCEPCPMCLAAIHWSRIAACYFGARIADAASAEFSEMPISAETMVTLGESRLVIHSDLLREECARLFSEWMATGQNRSY
jgi:tRNA(Arg) A34 adenosine deaminase TadA